MKRRDFATYYNTSTFVSLNQIVKCIFNTYVLLICSIVLQFSALVHVCGVCVAVAACTAIY